jgi:hypothetical protein
MLWDYFPQFDPEENLTSDRFHQILSKSINWICDYKHEVPRREFLSDLRDLSLKLSDGSLDDAFGRAIQQRKPIEHRSESLTKPLKASL